MKVTIDESGDLREAEAPFRVIADFESRYVEMSGDQMESARETIARATNACHGLEIPHGLNPGCIAGLLQDMAAYLDPATPAANKRTAQSILDRLSVFGIEPAPVSPAPQDRPTLAPGHTWDETLTGTFIDGYTVAYATDEEIARQAIATARVSGSTGCTQSVAEGARGEMLKLCAKVTRNPEPVSP